MKRLFVFLSILFLVGCSTNTSLIEIKKHIYVEKEFEDSWLELNKKGDSYIKEELQGGYQYSYDQKYLKQFFKDGGRIELYNYSIKKENLIISGEMKPPSTILLVHPNIENVTSEGVILHELGHYFDYKYHFSKDKEFIEIKKQNKNLFDSKSNSEYFAECFKEYISHHDEKISMFLSYMKKVDHKILKKK